MSQLEKSSPSNDLVQRPRNRSLELLELHKSETPQHFVQFYHDDSLVIANIAYLAAKALEAGSSCVIIATEPHLQAIDQRLAASVSGLDSARASGRYRALNAAHALEQLLTRGLLDKAKYERVIGGIIGDAVQSSGNGFVFAFGEMVALLSAERKSHTSVRLEQLWNDLAKQHRFSLCCAYPLDAFTGPADLNVFFEICSEHALVIPAETLL